MAHFKFQNQELFMKVNGKMVSLMELENFFFKMAPIFMELFPMGLYMEKGDLFQQLDPIMKDRLGIM